MLNAFYNFTHYALEKCWIVIQCLPKSLIKHSFDGNKKTCLGYAILVFVGWHRSWAVTSVTKFVSPRVANTPRKFPCCITVSSHEHYGVSNNRYIDSLSNILSNPTKNGQGTILYGSIKIILLKILSHPPPPPPPPSIIDALYETCCWKWTLLLILYAISGTLTSKSVVNPRKTWITRPCQKHDKNNRLHIICA